MSNSIANPNFFKSGKKNSPKKEVKPEVESIVPETKVDDEPIDVSLRINNQLLRLMDKTADMLKKEKLTSFASEIENMKKDTSRQRFTVAVVGEFSRGKSTFINNMFQRELLPVANMPTTAMLTRIRYSEKEAIAIFDADRKNKQVLPLTSASWENYIADDNGNDPNGVAFVGIKSPWLKNGIEIIDTPGAGDLEAKRANIIGDALKSSDSAIITISAEAAMSMSEKLFIEERLISKKTPFLMLIITKLDRISKQQRNSIVDFVKEKLKIWKMGDIPVYVPADVEMPDEKYKSIVGMDKVINQINSWISGSDRKKLTEQWVALKLKGHLQSVSDFINEQKCLAEAENDRQRDALIQQKSQMIEKAVSVWEETKLEMMKKGNECYDLFLKKAEEYKVTITEKLQYEVMHASNLKKWWENDYPYRLKIEMTNMSTSMENIVSRQVAKDVSWFNSVLDKNFKAGVIYNHDDIADKDVYTQFNVNTGLQIKDMSTERNISRIGITALSITSALVFASVGVASIIGTMGIGTGGSIISDTLFKKKIESQKESLKAEIERCVPQVVSNAMQYSEKRVKNIYFDVVSEASKQQQTWVNTQKQMVSTASTDTKFKDTAKLNEILSTVESLSAEIDKHISF